MAVILTLGACGPDHKPEAPCDGPSFNLVLRAEDGPLPDDTRINIKYGGNQDGEPYELGESRTPQAVFCDEDTTLGGAGGASSEEPAGNAGGASPEPSGAVHALRCRLYTQGPARLDASATGYTPIMDYNLMITEEKRCEVKRVVTLLREMPETTK